MASRLPLEFQRIDALRGIFRASTDSEVGLGDDAAVLAESAGALVCTVDAAVEGVHFDRSWLRPGQIGFRAFMAAASDVAAMGAQATHALCAWTLPSDFDETALHELAHGTERASLACAAPVIGGNLARAERLTLTTTVLGRVHESAVERRGGSVGQALYVTGPLGGPRVGLEQLRHDSSVDDAFTRAFAAPRARLDLAPRLREVASCAIDLSDGLLPDLRHLCRASAVGARLDLAKLPRLAGHEDTCRRLGLDPHETLLSGGEEYELLFAAAPGLSLNWATPIGELVVASEGLSVLGPDGNTVPMPAGFEHFG